MAAPLRTLKSETGVVVVLKDTRLVLLASNVERTEAAHLIRSARRALPAIKYFPAPPSAAKAATTIHNVNRSGVVKKILGDPAHELAHTPA
jgi:hypothetical protein